MYRKTHVDKYFLNTDETKLIIELFKDGKLTFEAFENIMFINTNGADVTYFVEEGDDPVPDNGPIIPGRE